MRLTLNMVSPGKKVRIMVVEGGVRCRQCLAEMGVHPGDIVKVLRSAPFSGPIIVETNGAKVMLGRGMASKIVVEVID